MILAYHMTLNQEGQRPNSKSKFSIKLFILIASFSVWKEVGSHQKIVCSYVVVGPCDMFVF